MLKVKRSKPENIIQVDANPVAQQRNYKIRNFICGDAKDVLTRVLEQLQGTSKVDADYDAVYEQLHVPHAIHLQPKAFHTGCTNICSS
ncbi:hypothetical protein FKN07_19510 [Proteus mirabilis]|nr:hypothetical protein FKN07_19510 [Proteus mirabilis]